MLNVFEELGDTSRRQILAELRSGPKNVSQICEATGLKQPNVSNHLARMRSRSIVSADKNGRQVFYRLGSPEVEAIVNSVFNAEATTPVNLNFSEMAHTYAKAAILGDEYECGQVLDRAFREKTPLLDIYQDILAPAMGMVGAWYKVQAIDEAQEHMASAITERMMARTAQITGPMRRLGKTAVLGCAENAHHVIGLRMLSDYLRLRGWRTLYLGANVPHKSFLATVVANQPQVVMLSCASMEGTETTIHLIRQLSELKTKRPNFQIGVGGGAIAENPEPFFEAGADFTANDLRAFARERVPLLEGSNAMPSTDRADFVKSN